MTLEERLTALEAAIASHAQFHITVTSLIHQNSAEIKATNRVLRELLPLVQGRSPEQLESLQRDLDAIRQDQAVDAERAQRDVDEIREALRKIGHG